MFLDLKQLPQFCIGCIFALSLPDTDGAHYEVHAEHPEDEDEYFIDIEPQLVYDYDASDPDDT